MTENRTRKLAAVWFADIVGYTALSTRDEDAALEVVDEFQRLVREAVGEKGRVVKFLGDGALSIFDSTNRAIETAIWLRDAFEGSPVARRHGCTLSVGVHMGEVVAAEDGDVYGDGVNVAARIEGVATSGQVLVSEDVYRLIRNRSGYNPLPVGEHTLKGVGKPVALYVLARDGENAAAVAPALVAAGGAPAATSATGGRAHGSHRRAVALGTIAGVAGFALLSVFVASTATVGDGDRSEGGTADDRQPAATQPADASLQPEPAAGPAGTPPAARRSDGTAPASAGVDRDTGAATPDRPATRAPTGAAARAGGQSAGGTPAGANDQPAADAPPANGLAVLVFSEGPGVQMVEQALMRSLGARNELRVMDATSLGLTRRNEDAIRAALQGDFADLATVARRSGTEFLVVGGLETSAVPAAGTMFTGSAQLGLRMYRISTGELVQTGTFGVGTGRVPGVAAPTEMAARSEAAQAVGRQGAVAARAWLARALRN